MMVKILHNSLNTLKSAVILLCRGLLRLYQWIISPLFPPACRFHPSCSEYAKQAITTHGSVRGLWLAAKRLFRCHPWGASGPDPVPERKHSC